MTKTVFRGLLILVGLYIAISLSYSVYDVWKRRDVVRERQDELSQVQAENKRLKQELGEAETPEFIEREARDKLGLAKPGETVVIIDGQPTASDEAQARTADLPSWKVWWRLFF